MAISAMQKKENQKYLIGVLFIVLLVTGLVVWQGAAKPESAVALPTTTQVADLEEIRIDFSIFSNPILDKLEPFKEISPLEGISVGDLESGRDNPFVPF